MAPFGMKQARFEFENESLADPSRQPQSGLASFAALERRLSRFPRTRYQGSKRRLAHAIVSALGDIEYQSVLDAFGGTAAVSYAFKCLGKSVTYNDALKFNQQIGTALIENQNVRISEELGASIGERRPDGNYRSVIEETFGGIYFTDEENQWLDVAVGNIQRIANRFERALAWFALFQAALVKRPFNLFHRRNLYMRTADVPRSFGNKSTWDRPFSEWFLSFAAEANEAVFLGAGDSRAICTDAAAVAGDFDLVYIDPPYMNRRGVGVPYRSFYHFLEGLVGYDVWPATVDRRSTHRALQCCADRDSWQSRVGIFEEFRRIFGRFERSAIVVSYRSDGIPSIDELQTMLARFKKCVRIVEMGRKKYVLSRSSSTREILIIGTG